MANLNRQNSLNVNEKMIGQALRESQARLTGIIASAMDAIITTDDQQNIILFNRAAEKTFGYSAEQILGKPLSMLLPERFRARHEQHVRRFGESGATNRSMGRLGTLYGLRANGQEFPIEASISQLKLEEGTLFTVILRDVSERAEAEEKLRESEEYLRATFEQAAVGIAHVAPDGMFIRVNQRLLEITGFSRDELLARSFQAITHPDDLEPDQSQQNRLLSGEIQTYTLEKRYIRRDGQTVWVNVAVSVMRDANGEPKYLQKIVEDITERRRAEDALQARAEEMKSMTRQLWQTARLATMGELAASIAHELNNPLAILSLRIESLLASDGESDLQGELKVMEQEVDRMASLVANLLQFSRSAHPQISTLDVSEEVDRTLELLHSHLAHARVTVQRDYAPQLPMIQADRQQLRQLFLNLFTNAGDAMPDGGVLSIQIAPLDENRRVRIVIQDSGIGISPEVLPRILEPFFTTKQEGKGTGLGLSICRRIVEEHHGQFLISSPGVGKGTRVEIVLPGANASRPRFLED